MQRLREDALDTETAPRRRGRPQSQAPELAPADTSLSEPVERQVYRSIRRGLMSGLIAPGAVLSSRSLATQLAVSAQPVRDALKRLEADGVLESRPQSGFFLRSLTVDEYREITGIRQRLEGMAAFHAAQRIQAPAIAKLRKLNAAMARIRKPQQYLAQNFEFHFTVYEGAGLPSLLAIIENLWMRIGPQLHHHPHEFNRTDTMRKHDAIIDALERRDSAGAEAAVAYDLGSAADFIVQSLPPA
ncbi:MAG: GntR family transcriptional regulator [Rhizobiaceae bacterium]